MIRQLLRTSIPAEVNAATEEKTLDMLQYIQFNIYFPEKLRASVISITAAAQGHTGTW